MAHVEREPSRHPSWPARGAAAAALLFAVTAAPACSVRAGRAPAQARPAAAAARPAPAPPRAPAAAPEGWASDAPQPDPEASRLFLSAVARPAAAPSQGAPPRVTALALANTAAGEARGMRAEGGPQSATLGEGERVTLEARIAPGECAVFIAHGGLGVIEVDLFLTAPGRPAPRILAQDPDTGPIAVIGGRGACYVNRGGAPLAAELHAQVRRGRGVVLVQGYRGPAAPAPAVMRPPP